METYKCQLQEVYNRIFGKNMDSKSLTWWANCLANNLHNIGDFESTMLQSDEYIAKVSAMYKAVWIDHMYTTDINQDAEDNFIEHNLGRHVTNESIFEHITKQMEYEVKHRGIITTEFHYLKNEIPTVEIVEFYLKKFQSNMQYTIADLDADISADAHICNNNKTEDEHSNQLEAPLEITSLIATLDPKLPEVNKDIIDAFEAAFSRPIYIHEYFKYQTASPDEFPLIYDVHVQNFNHLQEIYKTYTGVCVDEYNGYIKKYLDLVDEPSFFDQIIDEIINSDQYEQGMRVQIFKKFKSLYDEDLDAQDISYLFDIIKKQKLSISDDMISRILAMYKQNTDDIMNHIFKTYVLVLGRQPDMYEIEQYSVHYRNEIDNTQDVTYDIIDSNLESKLMRSLEFHDIIKKKIKELYTEMKGKDILSSLLFDVLNRVLLKIQEKDMKFSDVEGEIKLILETRV